MANDVTIIETKRIKAVAPERLGKWDRIVYWQIGPGQVFMTELPDEGFTDQALQAAIKRDLDERAKLVGKKYQL